MWQRGDSGFNRDSEKSRHDRTHWGCPDSSLKIVRRPVFDDFHGHFSVPPMRQSSFHGQQGHISHGLTFNEERSIEISTSVVSTQNDRSNLAVMPLSRKLQAKGSRRQKSNTATAEE
uniref:Uncharacterized protein n=1 Tax=Peronospora matthiolae TaxID=2874970 RepID=A0AAV1T372_9STRA